MVTGSAGRVVHAAAKPPVQAVQPQRRAAQSASDLQRKPLIGRVDDPLEREADRIADAVAAGRLTSPVPPATAPCLQRKCSACAQKDGTDEEPCEACAGTIRRQMESEEPEEEDELQLKAADHAVVGTAVRANAAVAANAVSSGGRPMPGELRAYFEPRFGRDLSEVRVHTHGRAAQAASAIHARAYTLGDDIAFAPGLFAPGTAAGRRLIAHELSHVMQQRSGGERSAATIRRQNGAGTATPQPAQPPSYGRACSGGANDPCQYDRCDEHHATIADDLARAIGYVDSAVQALGTSPLAGATTRALDWYFNDTSPETASTVHDRLACIRDCLQGTLQTNNYGCHPDRGGNDLAYVCIGATPPCTEVVTPVCLTNSHFDQSPRVRAQTLIHECAHRVGMSLGTPHSVEDIYRHTSRFLFLDTEVALLNSDSYALFAGAIAGGVPVTFVITEPSISAGLAIPRRGEETWQAKLYLGVEAQHPVLGIFNPTLGVGVSVIGETTTGGPSPVTSPPSMLLSLLAGVRIGDPRPGAAGGGYMSLFGGPAKPLGEAGIGAEVGVAFGYRWRVLDVSAGMGYTYDPTREAGMQDLLMLGASVSFLPFHLSRHR